MEKVGLLSFLIGTSTIGYFFRKQGRNYLLGDRILPVFESEPVLDFELGE